MNMRWQVALALGVVWCAALAAAAEEAARPADADTDDADDADDELSLHEEESRNVRPRAYTASAYNALPSGFRPTPSLAELAGYQRGPLDFGPSSAPAGAPAPATHALLAFADQPQPQRHQQRKPQQQQAQHQQEQRPAKLQRLQAELEEEEEEEREEPDRLTQLLQQTKFDCVGKQSGYYADQELACEVFHYCQDSVKHSWICPDGFTFHQVHLICMPPTHDNICQKSAKYHFVNEYLYRPINEEEVQRKPNVTLKYSDRYYPAEVYRDDRYDEEEDEEEEAPRRAAPAAVQQLGAPAPLQARPSPRPHAPQVFRSAEEVNIPLGQRRPQRPYDFDF